MTGLFSRSPFSSTPRLPVVPPPVDGESLASWIDAVGEVYGFQTGAEFLHDVIGISSRLTKRDDFPRRLMIRPPYPLIDALARETGISRRHLLGMTFDDVHPCLEEACYHWLSPCETCESLASMRANRKVSLRGCSSPWRLACHLHPPMPGAGEVGDEVDITSFYCRYSSIVAMLELASFGKIDKNNDIPLSISVESFIRLAHAINSVFKIFIAYYDHDSSSTFYRIDDSYKILESDDKTAVSLAKDRRNTMPVSAMFAYDLMTKPWEVMLYRLDYNGRLSHFRKLVPVLHYWLNSAYWNEATRKLSSRDYPTNEPRVITDLAHRIVSKYCDYESEDYYRLLKVATNRHRILLQVEFKLGHDFTVEFPVFGPFRTSFIPDVGKDPVTVEKFRIQRAIKGRNTRRDFSLSGVLSHQHRYAPALPYHKRPKGPLLISDQSVDPTCLQIAEAVLMDRYGTTAPKISVHEQRRTITRLAREEVQRLEMQRLVSASSPIKPFD